jgi:hypothetical protein
VRGGRRGPLPEVGPERGAGLDLAGFCAPTGGGVLGAAVGAPWGVRVDPLPADLGWGDRPVAAPFFDGGCDRLDPPR